jgi:phage shock protein A
MSLTAIDLQQIRTMVREEMESIVSVRVDPRFDSLDGRLEALDNDIKDIYKMISELQKLTRSVAHFEKYDLEQKILKTYESVVAIAKEAGVTLPRV